MANQFFVQRRDDGRYDVKADREGASLAIFDSEAEGVADAQSRDPDAAIHVIEFGFWLTVSNGAEDSQLGGRLRRWWRRLAEFVGR